MPMSVLGYTGLSGEFVIEPGVVEVSAGSSSSDIRSSAKFTITGKTSLIKVRTARSSPSQRSARQARQSTEKRGDARLSEVTNMSGRKFPDGFYWGTKKPRAYFGATTTTAEHDERPSRR